MVTRFTPDLPALALVSVRVFSLVVSMEMGGWSQGDSSIAAKTLDPCVNNESVK